MEVHRVRTHLDCILGGVSGYVRSSQVGSLVASTAVEAAGSLGIGLSVAEDSSTGLALETFVAP